MHDPFSAVRRYDPRAGTLSGAVPAERRLRELGGVFADEKAFAAACADGNPLVYTVASAEPAAGAGDLHYGIGTLMPGRVGAEFFQTKGHLHAMRDAAETYIGLRGKGLMLLEDERTGACTSQPLEANTIVYVPGFVAHRTVNTGSEPLVYLGVYPARAGHDYGTIAEKNFSQVVVERAGRIEVVARTDFLASLR